MKQPQKLQQPGCEATGDTTLYLLSESITVKAYTPTPEVQCTDAVNPSFTFKSVKVDVTLDGTYTDVELVTPPPLQWSVLSPALSTATCTLVAPLPPPAQKGIKAVVSYYYDCTVTQWGDTVIKFEGTTVQTGVVGCCMCVFVCAAAWGVSGCVRLRLLCVRACVFLTATCSTNVYVSVAESLAAVQVPAASIARGPPPALSLASLR
jgi:hypothetical protein